MGMFQVGLCCCHLRYRRFRLLVKVPWQHRRDKAFLVILRVPFPFGDAPSSEYLLVEVLSGSNAWEYAATLQVYFGQPVGLGIRCFKIRIYPAR